MGVLGEFFVVFSFYLGVLVCWKGGFIFWILCFVVLLVDGLGLVRGWGLGVLNILFFILGVLDLGYLGVRCVGYFLVVWIGYMGSLGIGVWVFLGVVGRSEL